MERNITVRGAIAYCHPWVHDSEELKVDHTYSVAMLNDALLASQNKLVLIEGSSGSGKTIFSTIYAKCTENATHIDISALAEKEREDIGALMTDEHDIFVLDEAWLCNQDALDAAVTKHLARGATVVVLTQSLRDISLTMKDKAIVFTIVRSKTPCSLVPFTHTQRVLI